VPPNFTVKKLCWTVKFEVTKVALLLKNRCTT